MESDRRSSFETHSAKAFASVVASMPAFGGEVESETMSFQPFDIGERGSESRVWRYRCRAIRDRREPLARRRLAYFSSSALRCRRMARAKFVEYPFGGNGPRGIGLHGVVDRRRLLPQPALDRGIPFLQRPQASAHDFASRRIVARGDFRVDNFPRQGHSQKFLVAKKPLPACLSSPIPERRNVNDRARTASAGADSCARCCAHVGSGTSHAPANRRKIGAILRAGAPTFDKMRLL